MVVDLATGRLVVCWNGKKGRKGGVQGSVCVQGSTVECVCKARVLSLERKNQRLPSATVPARVFPNECHFKFKSIPAES